MRFSPSRLIRLGNAILFCVLLAPQLATASDSSSWINPFRILPRGISARTIPSTAVDQALYANSRKAGGVEVGLIELHAGEAEPFVIDQFTSHSVHQIAADAWVAAFLKGLRAFAELHSLERLARVRFTHTHPTGSLGFSAGDKRASLLLRSMLSEMGLKAEIEMGVVFESFLGRLIRRQYRLPAHLDWRRGDYAIDAEHKRLYEANWGTHMRRDIERNVAPRGCESPLEGQAQT